MNINQKYQPVAQPLQAQQILLQQLQQGQQAQQAQQVQQQAQVQAQQSQFDNYGYPQYNQTNQVPGNGAGHNGLGAGAANFQNQALNHVHKMFQQKPNIDPSASQYWQHQIQLAQLSRQSNYPHFYARQYAQNSRKNKFGDVKPVNLVEATKQLVSVLEEENANQSNSVLTPTTSSALLYNKKITHDEDDHLQEEQRVLAKTQGKQLWCQLDLSGQGLINVSPKLFNYDFLESLYLNNNKLTHIPSIISKLKGLRVLDLSNNRISELPSSLGLCYNLKYLYLFDNNIQTLPSEFGNLIELVFLGIEGNPIDMKYAEILAEKGTEQLIAYLRDLKPVPYLPKPRPWYLLEDDGEIIDPAANPQAYASETESPDTFTLMSYNVLCHHYATTRLYKYTPSWALEWDYRRNLLQEEILKANSDVVCLQEVETRSYSEFWVPLMAKHGYKGLFYNKTRSKTMSEREAKKVDGCATFYKTSKFTLIARQTFEYNSVCMGSDKYKKTKDLFNRFMNKDNIALLAFLQHIETGEKILVVTTHLHWDPAFNDVKTLQVGILLEELQGIMKKLLKTNSLDDVKNSPLIIAGDFNSTRDSAVYQLFTSGKVSKHEDLDGRDYGRFTDEGFLQNFKLKSAYDFLPDMPFTNFTPTFVEFIDYAWYSTSSLQVKGLLGKVDEEYASHYVGTPNAHFPSDHIPIMIKFQIKKSGSKKADFKPDFKGTSRKT